MKWYLAIILLLPSLADSGMHREYSGLRITSVATIDNNAEILRFEEPVHAAVDYSLFLADIAAPDCDETDFPGKVGGMVSIGRDGAIKWRDTQDDLCGREVFGGGDVFYRTSNQETIVVQLLWKGYRRHWGSRVLVFNADGTLRSKTVQEGASLGFREHYWLGEDRALAYEWSRSQYVILEFREDVSEGFIIKALPPMGLAESLNLFTKLVVREDLGFGIARVSGGDILFFDLSTLEILREIAGEGYTRILGMTESGLYLYKDRIVSNVAIEASAELHYANFEGEVLATLVFDPKDFHADDKARVMSDGSLIMPGRDGRLLKFSPDLTSSRSQRFTKFMIVNCALYRAFLHEFPNGNIWADDRGEQYFFDPDLNLIHMDEETFDRSDSLLIRDRGVLILEGVLERDSAVFFDMNGVRTDLGSLPCVLANRATVSADGSHLFCSTLEGLEVFHLGY